MDALFTVALGGRLAAMPAAYLLLWAGTLLLSALLIVLLRSRWGQSRPLQKCAVLSLLVHLLLAWAAMTVQFLYGDGGGGSAEPPIRVRIVHDVDPRALPEIVTTPAPALLDAPSEVEMVAAVDASATPEDVTGAKPEPVSVTNDPILKQDDSTPKAEDLATSDHTELVKNQIDDVATVAQDDAETVEPRMTTQSADSDTATSAATVQSSSEEIVVSSPYSLRTAPERLRIVERQGGSAQTEAAVAAALHWLAGSQSPNGHWDANRYGAGQEQVVLGHDRGGAGRNADTGISALALLAFLGAGHTHIDGEYADTVRRGLDFLLRSQAADGNLFGNATLYAQMYCHSMATFALAEAQAMTNDRRLEPAVTKAVNFCVAAQNAATGGWRYRVGDTGDTSQLGWQMMALASAQQAGVNVPSHTWIRVDRFLSSVSRGNYGGLACYRPDSGPSTTMTAEALYCRLLLVDVLGERLDEAAAIEASSQLLAALPTTERVNLYYWYYASLALHHRLQHNERAAAEWMRWNNSLTAALLATQVTNGQDAGSWDTNTVWGGYGGRVYTTAMAAMCLEVYYRYTPAATGQARWTATRPEESAPTRR